MADNSGPSGMLIIGILVVIILTAGLTYFIANAQGTNQTGDVPTITVRGEASKTVTPDLIILGLSVETTGDNASEAQAENAVQTAAVKDALLAAGLQASEIETSSYYTYAVYNESCSSCYPMPYYGAGEYPKDAPMPMMPASEGSTGAASPGIAYPEYYPCRQENCNIVGYKTIHQITVRSGKTTDGGKFIEASLDDGAAKVDYVYFTITEETRIKTESALQAAAAASAKTKAENIAEGLGARLGKLVMVTPDYYPIYPPVVYAYERDTSGVTVPPTEIFPTDTALSSSMTVVYELDQQ